MIYNYFDAEFNKVGHGDAWGFDSKKVAYVSRLGDGHLIGLIDAPNGFTVNDFDSLQVHIKHQIEYYPSFANSLFVGTLYKRAVLEKWASDTCEGEGTGAKVLTPSNSIRAG